MNLILFQPHEVAADGRVRLTGVRAAHVVGVLKTAPGQTVRVGILDGPRGVGTIEAIDPEHVDLRCEFDGTIPQRPPVDLLLALPRPKVMRRLWAQLAALGVGHVALTNASRVERDYFDTHLLAPEGYMPLLVEGLQQSRDTRVPRVSIHKRFRVLIEDELAETFGAGLRLVGDPSGTRSAREVVEASPGENGERVLLAVGPEGGWNTFEMDLLAAHGFRPISLGPRTLRTDTACVALLAVVHDAVTSRIKSAEIP